MDTSEVVDGILLHFGKKGMRWGVRRRDTSKGVTVSSKGKRLKSSGGVGHPAHADAVRARTLGQIGKKSGLKSLSDKDLQDYSKRLNLEQGVKRLNYNNASPPKKFVLKVLGQTGSQLANESTKAGATAVGKKALALAMA